MGRTSVVRRAACRILLSMFGLCVCAGMILIIVGCFVVGFAILAASIVVIASLGWYVLLGAILLLLAPLFGLASWLIGE